jgi:hypothetical protein
MKKLALLVLLLTTASYAAILNAPFMPEIDARFNALEGGNVIPTTYPIGSADGHEIQGLAQATYDFSKVGGAIGTYSLGVKLPANAIITQSYLYSITQPTTAASGTLAFQCQNANDIITATAAASYSSAGAAIAGSSTAAASAFKYTTAACTIQATIATGALTAGKVTAFVEYVVHK